jgi:type V secretory pathway adhesin AidA
VGQLFDKKLEVCTGSNKQKKQQHTDKNAREKGSKEPRCKNPQIKIATNPYAYAGRGDARW